MNISAYRADYLPLIGQLMNQMKLPQIINETVSKPQKVFSNLTHSNIKLYDINSSSIRVDTTSKSFYGAYETNKPEPIDVTQGFSKDKRHDLKQLMFGTATSSDGIPILGEVMSGNTSDMTFNNGWIKTVSGFT